MTQDNVDVRSELEGVIGGAVLVAAGTLLSVGLNVAARAVFARSFTPESYGEFSLGFTLLIMFSLVACLGLQNGLPRQIAFDEADDNEGGRPVESGGGRADDDAPTGEAGTQILWALLLSGGLGLAVGAVLFASNRWLAVEVFSDPNYARPIALVSLGIPLFTSIRVMSAIFRGYSRPHERVLFQGLLRNGAFLILLGVVIYLGRDHLAGIATLSLSLGVTALLYFRYLYRDNPGRFRDGVVGRLRNLSVPVSLVRFSYPLMIATLLLQLMTWMDILMLGYLSTSRSVGLYDAVRPLVRIIYIVWQGMIFMYIPLVSDMYATDDLESIRRVYIILTKWFASASVPLVLLFLFFPGSTLRAVFGPSFTVAAPALQALAVAYCLGNIIGPTGATLIAMGHTRILMAINLVSGVVNFVLNVALIPELGLLGAALATMAAIVLRNLLRLIQLYRVGRIHALRGVIYRPLGVTTGLAVVLSVLIGPVGWPKLVALFAALSVAFVASFRLTGSVSMEDGVLVSYVVSAVGSVTPSGLN
ncbi:hypothetical protein Z052_13925 [Halorubrum sp. C191]|uniref:flippase n=1 Tax=Halorubrum sp. C191 TaxID=1383842 RepID=UPI000C087B09|nr:flippase [Halorubrum sp. C191]PHQ41598.1 hypothetical protein Z052_13925 [Halorubrum sp. C191]